MPVFSQRTSAVVPRSFLSLQASLSPIVTFLYVLLSVNIGRIFIVYFSLSLIITVSAASSVTFPVICVCGDVA